MENKLNKVEQYLLCLYSIYFPSSTIGYAVGWNNAVGIIKTSDAGNTWSVQTAGVSLGEIFYAVHFTNDTIGYVVGTNGIILKTTNGGAAGIEENNFSENYFSVYPNPSNDFVTIKLKNIVADKITISLTDLSGRKIKQWNLINAQKEIQLSINDIVPGCYFINVNFQNKFFTQKIIKL